MDVLGNDVCNGCSKKVEDFSDLHSVTSPWGVLDLCDECHTVYRLGEPWSNLQASKARFEREVAERASK